MLEISDVRAGYGAINVLWDVSMQIPEGQLTTIIGPNGAGKTTLLRAIMGLIPLSQGSIRFDGQPVEKTPTWEMLGRGLAMIPEGRMIFKDMSVEENLMLGAFPKAHRAGAQANCERAFEMFPRLKERRRQMAGTLSGGEAQMLAMGRGLMSDPKVLLIDEPSLGLAPVIVNELFDTLQRLKSEGRTIVLVEQNTHKAVAVADHVHLMRGGKVVLSQAARDVDVAELQQRYFAH
ncbi:MAG: ABC transporter ATP-binding protein [Castellaniella sp.]|uniref:ABC transporter ATP-binding protein n=1 Tax=Castellaniella sp. TaxID=1955812 RepID=UPI001204E133|nr:ABC transporter ATP-binding protein [Castellaniella sp.]TAN30899.1 MAG: ABC transporter ATP-binding protein [Castellaniella sp.]